MKWSQNQMCVPSWLTSSDSIARPWPSMALEGCHRAAQLPGPGHWVPLLIAQAPGGVDQSHSPLRHPQIFTEGLSRAQHRMGPQGVAESREGSGASLPLTFLGALPRLEEAGVAPSG